MKIAVVGTGYVGLVTGACFAESGHHVTCVDADERKIDALARGEMPVFEPSLEDLVRRNARARRLAFTTSISDAMTASDVAFIAVGTPLDAEGSADLTAVLAAAEGIGRCLRRYTVIINKSTVPVGGAETIARTVAAVAQAPFDVVANPEFLREGSGVDDFMRPDRVVVGVTSERARAVMAELFAPFVRTEQPLLFMDLRSAELTKYAANAMLATRVSFMNDVAALCERVDCDVDQVRRGMGADRRIGHPFLFPGVDFGGSGVRAVMIMARQLGLDFDILRSVERINERQKRLLFDKASKHFGGGWGSRRVAVWGLSFKPRTDDVREAPSLVLIQLLAGAGAEVTAYDPVAGPVARGVLGPRVRVAEDPYEAARGADALFLVTEWNEFRTPDFAMLRAIMRGNALFDGRNVWDPAKARAAGFVYHGVGRRNG